MSGRSELSISALVRKLTRLSTISDEAIAHLQNLPMRVHHERSGTTIIHEGELVSECCLLVRGFACRHKLTRGGGRQIVSFHIPGDLLDIQHLLFERADHNVQAISHVELVSIPITALRSAAVSYPDIALALWKDCLVDASVFREWVLNVGRRDAKARIAHMLCEFAIRVETVGLGSLAQFTLPMTQEEIADATGLTSIHVNRMLRALTEEGAIARRGREILIADWSKMQHIADFSPDYLHLAA